MRILHLSHNSLPDWRVEKSAITGAKHGHEVFFAGQKPPNTASFAKVFDIDWLVGLKIDNVSVAMLGVPHYWNLIKKQVKKILDQVRPDLIHAHNIYSAKMASEFKLPYVYDDHEYWSKHMSLVRIRRKRSPSWRNLIKKLGKYYLAGLYPAWEREIVSSAPVITVSDAIINDFREMYHSQRLFLVPNYPLMQEVKDIPRPHEHNEMVSVYAGGDDMVNSPPHRNLEGFPNLFDNNDIGKLVIIGPKGQSSKNVSYTGFLKRDQMYSEMENASIGILPWQSHWFHKYSNPNKIYEYAHAGLFVMCTSSFESVESTLRENCTVFDNYESLALQLSYMKNDMDELYNKRLKIFEFARSKLIWEHYEKNISAAYKAC